jgi:type IV pilus assembly protein PilN
MIKINLLPKEARKRVGIGEQLIIILLVLVVTFAGIGIYWSYLNGVIEEKRQAIARTNQRLQELQKIIDEIEMFEAQRLALEQKLEVIAKLGKEQKLPVRLLDELYLTLEDDLWLNLFQQSNQTMAVNGTALSNPVVSNYLRNLEQSEYFDTVELLSVIERVVGNQIVRDFQLSMNLVVPGETPVEEEE